MVNLVDKNELLAATYLVVAIAAIAMGVTLTPSGRRRNVVVATVYTLFFGLTLPYGNGIFIGGVLWSLVRNCAFGDSCTIDFAGFFSGFHEVFVDCFSQNYSTNNQSCARLRFGSLISVAPIVALLIQWVFLIAFVSGVSRLRGYFGQRRASKQIDSVDGHRYIIGAIWLFLGLAILTAPRSARYGLLAFWPEKLHDAELFPMGIVVASIHIAAGYAVLKKFDWAHWLCLPLTVLLLPKYIFGLPLGVYYWWYFVTGRSRRNATAQARFEPTDKPATRTRGKKSAENSSRSGAAMRYLWIYLIVATCVVLVSNFHWAATDAVYRSYFKNRFEKADHQQGYVLVEDVVKAFENSDTLVLCLKGRVVQNADGAYVPVARLDRGVWDGAISLEVSDNVFFLTIPKKELFHLETWRRDNKEAPGKGYQGEYDVPNAITQPGCVGGLASELDVRDFFAERDWDVSRWVEQNHPTQPFIYNFKFAKLSYYVFVDGAEQRSYRLRIKAKVEANPKDAVIGTILAPLALAVDVVTLPLQLVWWAVIMILPWG